METNREKKKAEIKRCSLRPTYRAIIKIVAYLPTLTDRQMTHKDINGCYYPIWRRNFKSGQNGDAENVIYSLKRVLRFEQTLIYDTLILDLMFRLRTASKSQFI